MKHIRINLDGDIEKACAEIDDLIKQIEELPQRFAEEGAKIAQQRYSGFPIVVNAEDNRVIATGEQVGFAEWGAGTRAVTDSDAPIPTGYGTWSTSPEGSQNLKYHHHWFYGGQLIDHVTPTLAMTKAKQYLWYNGADIARKHIK